MEINEYLDKMKVYNKENIIKDICETHNNNKYTSYCFKCNKHLCNDCLKTRKHIDHLKNNIIEIQPLKEELDIIQEVIKNYKIKVEILKKEKMIKQKKLNDYLIYSQLYENNMFEGKIQNIKNNLLTELKLNDDKYLYDIKQLKIKYFEEIKNRKNIYLNDKNKIENNYKLIEEKENIIHNFKIKKINKKYYEEIKKLKKNNKYENMNNILKLSEIIYNAYISYNNNYYNTININNIIISYFQNDYIKNNIIKKILNNQNND